MLDLVIRYYSALIYTVMDQVIWCCYNTLIYTVFDLVILCYYSILIYIVLDSANPPHQDNSFGLSSNIFYLFWLTGKV